MIDSMKINKEVMAEGAKGGFTNATDVADYLVKKGMPFRNAHEVSGKMVYYCISKDKAIIDMTVGEMKEFSELFEDDIFDYITPIACVKSRKVPGGPAPEAVMAHITKTEEFLKHFKADGGKVK